VADNIFAMFYPLGILEEKAIGVISGMTELATLNRAATLPQRLSM